MLAGSGGQEAPVCSRKKLFLQDLVYENLSKMLLSRASNSDQGFSAVPRGSPREGGC